MSDLHIAEITYEDGGLRYRFARRLSDDGTRWIRDGHFQAFHPNGTLASEGTYVGGHEDGLWRDYHDNGQIAAEGTYAQGAETGVWRYWDAEGVESA